MGIERIRVMSAIDNDINNWLDSLLESECFGMTKSLLINLILRREMRSHNARTILMHPAALQGLLRLPLLPLLPEETRKDERA